MRLIAKLACCAALAAPMTAAAAEIDCGKARGADETAICENRSLLVLDERLADAMVFATADMSAPDRKKLDREQLDWVKKRKSCGADPACLEETYLDRITELEGH